ncbi:MAG: hypothetical protein TECD_01058 [Hyphomicrobiaceae bacterium hypho_1]
MAIHFCDILISPTLESDLHKITVLHSELFGPGRFARTTYRIREGTPLISPFCHTAKWKGHFVAAISFTEIKIGNKSGVLLLGPLAVSASHSGLGVGRALVEISLKQAKYAGVDLVTLVGDLSYYNRVGFINVPKKQIILPGPFNSDRLLACELRQDALRTYRGLIHTT